MKRLISIVLTVCMLLSFVPVSAMAVDFSECDEKITAGSSQTVNITTAGECIYFIFIPEVSGTYTFCSEGNYDTYGYLYDENEELLASDDDSGDGNNFSVTHYFEEGIIYYLGARFYSSSKTGSFTVKLSDISMEITSYGQEIHEDVEYDIGYDAFMHDGGGIYNLELNFTPQNSGLYLFSAKTEQVNDWYASNPLSVSYITNENDDFIEYGSANSEKLIANLEEGCTYKIMAEVCGSMYEELTSSTYKIKAEPMVAGEAFDAGTDKEMPGDTNIYYPMTVEKTCNLILNTGSSWNELLIYNPETNTFCSNTWGDIEISASEGQELYVYNSSIDAVTVYSYYVGTADNTTVYTSSKEDLKTNHPYENNLDKTYVYTGKADTAYTEVKFSSETSLNSTRYSNTDFIYIYAPDGSEIGSYYGTLLAGKTVNIPGNTFSIKIVTDSNGVDYGFEVSEITEHSVIGSPVANKESGTHRPFNATLTAHALAEIYYSFSADDEFTKYTKPLAINESCKLYTYAKIGDKMSETAVYEYEINNSPVKPPVFTTVSSTDSEVKVSISAEEGTVYYKLLSSHSSFYKYNSGNITLNRSEVIAAYALEGTLKSEVVYYECTIEDTEENTLTPPVITVEDIWGGKKITVNPASDMEFYDDFYSNNYVDDHDSYSCGYSDENMSFVHSFGPWSYTQKSSYMTGYLGNSQKSVMLDSYDEADFPKVFDVTENTLVWARANKKEYTESGTWQSEMMDPYGDMYMHMKSYDNYDTNEQYSPRAYEYVTVEKTETPQIDQNGTTVSISTGENTKAYYSLNDSEFTEYTAPFEVSSGDVVKAYAVGLGTTQSDTAQITVITEEILFNETSVLGGKQVEITSGVRNAEIYFSTDGESFGLYSEPLFITADTTIYAYAKTETETTKTASVQVSVLKAKAPTGLLSGTYPLGTEISFACETEKTDIYYNTGSGDVKYTAPFKLSGDITISVYAQGVGIAKSDVVTFTYTILHAAPPQISVTDIMGGKAVSITYGEQETAYFSTDGNNYSQYTGAVNFYDIGKIYAYTAVSGGANSNTVEENITMTQTADPIPNYASGEIFKGTAVTLTSPNDGLQTEIYYTTDGSEPDNTSALYTDGIIINENTNIKAVAYAMGRAKSEVINLSYTLRVTKTPEIREEGINGGKKIYLSSQTNEAIICYTLDGTDPKTSQTAVLYKAPFVVSSNNTNIRAYAKCEGYIDSGELTHTVELGQLPAPVFSVTNDKVYVGDRLEISATDFAFIYYTTDGTDPTPESKLYTEPILINDDLTVRAIAVADGWDTSNVSVKAYTVYVTEKPYLFKKKNGNYMSIEMKSDTPNAVIYYTTDGTEPDNTSAVYSDALMLDKDTPVKAFAASAKRKNSPVHSETVFVKHTKEPASNFASGYVAVDSEIILTADEGAVIHYTTDGTDPTEESPVYSAPVKITGKTVIKAFAVKEEYLDSAVVTYEYDVLKTENPNINFGEDILGGKTVVITSDTPDAVIYYTTDGTDPTTGSAVYEEPVSIYDTTSLKAIAVCSGYLQSDIVSKDMFVPVADIIQTNDGYLYIGIRSGVEIKTALSKAHKVYYTTDGKEPNQSSDVWTPGSSLVFYEDTTVKAYAIDYGYKKSETVTLNFTIDTVNVYFHEKSTDEDGDGKVDYVTVSLSYTNGANVYYSIDGNADQTSTPYTDPVKITQDCVFSVFAMADGYRNATINYRVYLNVAKEPSVLNGISFENSSKVLCEDNLITLIKPDNNVNIYYKINNGDYALYESPVSITESDTLYAYCGAENYKDSGKIIVQMISAENIFPYVRIGVENVFGGKIYTADEYISADTNHYSYTHLDSTKIPHSIHYTTDGTDPTEESPVLNQSIFVDKDTTIKTLLVTKYKNSDINTYVVKVEKQPSVSFSPANNEIYKNTYITLSSGDPEANIYYTTDGTDPVFDLKTFAIANGVKYTEPFITDSDMNIKAIAVRKGYSISDVTSHNYAIKKVKTPDFAEKMTAGGKIITISCETENATIRYTLDGSPVTEASPVYTKPFKLKKNTVLNIKAECEFMADSYTVSEIINVPYDELSTIEIGEAVYTDDGKLLLPVKTHNNPGIAGYSISVKYDNSILTPVSAKSMWDGIFVSNIHNKENSGIDKEVSVTWVGNNSVYTDGTLFNIVFDIKDNIEPTETEFIIGENGVINHLYETVDVAYIEGKAQVESTGIMNMGLMMATGRSTVYTDSVLKFDIKKINSQTLEASVLIEENAGISAYNITLLYNTELFTPVSIENGNLFDSGVISNVTQPNADLPNLSCISALSCNDTDVSGDGTLFKIRFNINSPVYVEQIFEFENAELYNLAGDKIVANPKNVAVDKNNHEYFIETDNFDPENAAVKVYNYCNDKTDAVLILASFDNSTKAMSDIKTVPVTLAKGENIIDDIGNINMKNSDNPIIGIYLWSSMNDLLPLAEAHWINN